MNFAEITFGTPEYDESVELRTEVLRKPINLEFKEEDLALEFDQIHLGVYDLSLKLIGCLIFKPITEKTVKMRQVAIAPGQQGKGVGKELVQWSEKWAKYKGFELIELSARETAVPFYEKLNYDRVGERYTEVNIPHFAMKKII